ncbi:FHA domain-containing protein [Streptomyces mangrovisoli]|uniref:Cell division protein FtsK n=1 Tax=Streptomyces mangrovisoli TaxID=1428628 RepID=A0A1J4NUD2_9ACTN|nr:FHA domain-containing protein [Streptomyces mangrovisoli]OIJ65912.1 cell division protein FtsK [Streptomyces mangrovisoli]
MQIRLTVEDPLGSSPQPRGRAASRDVLVTAPAGTALAAVASALASAVAGESGTAAHERGREPGAGPVVLYAGAERLDAQRCTLGEPPLTDGAVLSLGAPADPEPHPEVDDAPARLHVVAGPDAGGVHLLHGGRIDIGRSADADVPLDDPDVSRLHCAVTVDDDGRVSVADLGSTNGTTLDGTRVGPRAVRFPAGALLRIGESTLRLAPAGGPGARVATAPDGEGHVRLAPAAGPDAPPAPAAPTAPSDGTRHTYGSTEFDGPDGRAGAPGHGAGQPPAVPVQGGAPRIESRAGHPRHLPGGPAAQPSGSLPGTAPGGDTHGAGLRTGTTAPGSPYGSAPGSPYAAAPAPGSAPATTHTPVPVQRATAFEEAAHSGRTDLPETPDLPRPRAEATDTPPRPSTGTGTTRKGTPLRGTDVPQGVRRRGLSAWARRLTGGRPEETPDGAAYGDPGADPAAAAAPAHRPETWPDPATLLLTALGPGPRLWERGPGHPETLTVRLGTADRPVEDGAALLPAVPVTADLREAGALGLAGPRPRLSGLARAVLAQLAALHSPDVLEIVLIGADRARSLEERTAEWSWLGWLPHVRPGHGQDCRLLLAHDREQAAARTEELLRRLEDQPPAPDTAPGHREAHPDHAERGAAHRPSWARAGDAGAPPFPGPYTVLVVDGDPGSAAVREAVERLALEGPRAGIHVLCLAETPPASPASPVTATYEAACAAAPSFRACGAVALLSGDVATALHLMRVARTAAAPAPVGHGTSAAVDAVSAAWAERFARALAPLRTDAAAGERHARVSAPLPQSARLLDELGLARATPASLMARWADAADDPRTPGGRAWAVLGAGPRGPLGADLTADGPHLLIEGPRGSGRTELLRAVVASLAAAERPDRLGIVLVDGRDGTGAPGGHGEGLRVCTDVPHVTTHLAANDPVRMREFAQSLSAELKRRAELLGLSDFAEWHTRHAAPGAAAGRRAPAARTAHPAAGTHSTTGTHAGAVLPDPVGAGDLESASSATLRLRPPSAARRSEPGPPLPRLVVVVDDLDALVSPPLGSPGRPAAGSVMRALEAAAREGERLGVHLVAATGDCPRTAETEPVRRAGLRVLLDAPPAGRAGGPAPERAGEQGGEPAPGRGRLTGPDGRMTPFQGGRVTGRIPRTATLRPTVVPLEWHRMGDPPARRPVRELGNGPTDLALLASALDRAARSVSAAEVPSLL